MGLERNSWEEIIVVVVLFAAYSVWALRGVQQIGIDVAEQTVAYYHTSLFVSSLLLLAGPDWYAAAVLALGVLILGVVASYRSGLLRLALSFPLFSRIFFYVMPLYPVATLVGYYLFAPWNEGDWWGFMAFLSSYLIPGVISWYQLRRHYPPQRE